MTFAGLQTRPQLGLRAPKNISRNITPATGGVAIHYGGPRVGITTSSPHSRCVAVWRSWQNYHMNTQGWSDIAYTGGACAHGYLLRGRGLRVRTAAQGTNDGNQRFYAVCWLGGDGETPSHAALAAIDEGIRRARADGAGNRVRAHRDFTSTSCPGPALTAHARARDGKAVASVPAAPAVVPGTKGPAKGILTMGESRFTIDGILDRGTAVALQKIWGTLVTGVFDAGTIRGMQRWLGVTADGIVGNQTRAALYGRIGYPHPGTVGWSYLWVDKPTPQTRLLEEHMNALRDAASVAPAWPFPSTHRIGPNPKGYSSWHDGTGSDTAGRAAIRAWQTQMDLRGWSLGPSGADGFWGAATATVASAHQTEVGITGETGSSIGPQTWDAAWTAPVT